MDDDTQIRRFTERKGNFRGSAKINLKHLTFDDTSYLDPKNIDRLEKNFELEGCLRLDLEHHIPAIINDSVLRESLQKSHIVNGDLLQQNLPPKLDLPPDENLRCLHGKHRIAAAKKFLYLPADKWWVVDLYSDGLSEPLCRDIREEYANSRNFCDGDIFLQLRYCEKRQDSCGAGRWYARLSESKRKDVKRLFQRKDLAPMISALDKLLPYIGLWPSLRIGSLHNVMSQKCHEEVEHYLKHVKQCWDEIICFEQKAITLIDFRTVQHLQARSPWASKVDRDFITIGMRNYTLFPLIQDPVARAEILKNLLNAKCMIPSLGTFLEDVKWLEPCAKVIRGLLCGDGRNSTRQSAFRCYSGVNRSAGKARIQKSDLQFTERPASEMQAMMSAYLQIWSFAWRHFPELSAMLPRKDVGKPKPPAVASNVRCWRGLAQLAQTLGFESERITTLTSHDPDMPMVDEFLRRARPDALYQMSDQARAASTFEICRVLSNIQEPTNIVGTPTPTVSREWIPIEHRCGRPFQQSHEESKHSFFLLDLYATKEQTISYFSVNRDIFHAFFGQNAPAAFLGVAPLAAVWHLPEPMQIDTVKVTQSSQHNEPRLQHQFSMDHFTFTQSHGQRGRVAKSRKPLTQGEAPGNDNGNLGTGSQHDGTVQAQSVDDASESRLFDDLQDDENIFMGGTDMLEPPRLEPPRLEPPRLEPPRLQPPRLQPPRLQPPRLQPSDPGHSELFRNWKKSCKDGDILLVDIRGDATHFSPQKKLPSAIASIANDSYFAVYDEKTKSFKTIQVKYIFKFGKGPQYDGVVYACVKSWNTGLPTIDIKTKQLMIEEYRKMSTLHSWTAGSTRERLGLAEAFILRKKRDKPVPTETQTKPLKIREPETQTKQLRIREPKRQTKQTKQLKQLRIREPKRQTKQLSISEPERQTKQLKMRGELVLNSQRLGQEGIVGTEIAVPTEGQINSQRLGQEEIVGTEIAVPIEGQIRQLTTGEPVLNSQRLGQEGIAGTEIAVPTEGQINSQRLGQEEIVGTEIAVPIEGQIRQLTTGEPVLNSQTPAEETTSESEL